MISQTAEYALRAVVYLATCDGTSTNREEISNATQIPANYLSKVMQALDRAGVVLARRGVGGGYTLSVSPQELSVYDVVTAITPLPRLHECPLNIEGHTKLCPLHQRLDDATQLVEDALKSTSIAELLPKRTGKNSCRFPKLE